MRAAAFIDLDRTLLKGASGPIISRALREAGVVGGSSLPGEDVLYRVFNVFGENLPSMLIARQGVTVMKGKPRHLVVAAAHSAVDQLMSLVRDAARAVIDARGPRGAMPGLALGWQKFVGIEFAAAAPEPDCATVMDATVPQIDGYRFVYTLPLGPQRVLVEDTYYSDEPTLDRTAVADRVRAYAAARGLYGDELREEHGVLPVLIGGDPDLFWPTIDPVARLGLAGGFFHPTTGYSFRLALEQADALAALDGDFAASQLAAWSRGRFMAHWRASWFFRELNRMLFRAAAPTDRYRIFAHFYRLPPSRIARFYAGTLTPGDCLRILSGKPPVPIGAALRALLQR